jgi:iron(III) transport system ATP-binding protein
MGWPLAIWRRQEPILLAGAGVVLGVLALLPLASLGGELFRGEALRHAGEALSTPRTWLLFATSLEFAAAVTALSLAIGLPLGVLLGRSDLPCRGLALWLHAFPVFVPPFLLGLGWFHLFGRTGFAGSDATARLLFSWPGAVAVLAMALTPIVTSLVAVGLQGVDPSLEEAAVLVAGPGRAAARILLPLVRPAIALAALVVFSLAFSELGVPMFLRVSVYPAMVFSRLGGVDYAPGEAFALALPLFAVAVALLVFERRAAGRRSFAGETLSVLGSSGSGKTTLLRAIAGFMAPQLGVVRIGDALASEGGRLVLAPEERDVAMVFQDLALWPHLTVHGNLAFGLDGKRVARGERDDRIAAMLRRVGLSGKERRHPGELSGGERQRVAIARALVLEPRAVLFDEPLSNLDIGLKQELLALFRELLGERHATTLYVTHDPREAQALGDRTAVLDQGRIVHLGRLDALRSRPDLPLARVILEALG